jgi:hypothetical protein
MIGSGHSWRTTWGIKVYEAPNIGDQLRAALIVLGQVVCVEFVTSCLIYLWMSYKIHMQRSDFERFVNVEESYIVASAHS